MEQNDETLRVHAIVKRTTVLGPGERFALWLQGCEKNCPSCMSSSARDKRGGTLIRVSEILQSILSEKGLEGITISGGEPFLQYRALYNFLKQLREQSRLGVILYTGYYLDELRGMNNPEIHAITAKLSDIIIDGPYLEELSDGKPLRGSSNQTIHLTSKRYARIYPDIYGQPGRKCEIHLNNKEAFLVGIPDEHGYKVWQNIIAAVGRAAKPVLGDMY